MRDRHMCRRRCAVVHCWLRWDGGGVARRRGAVARWQRQRRGGWCRPHCSCRRRRIPTHPSPAITATATAATKNVIPRAIGAGEAAAAAVPGRRWNRRRRPLHVPLCRPKRNSPPRSAGARRSRWCRRRCRCRCRRGCGRWRAAALHVRQQRRHVGARHDGGAARDAAAMQTESITHGSYRGAGCRRSRRSRCHH